MKSEQQIKDRISRLETKIERLEKIANAPQVTLGSFETGRSNYRMGKSLDAENTRRMNAFRDCEAAKNELSHLKSLLANHQAGERHLNGRPRAALSPKSRYAHPHR